MSERSFLRYIASLFSVGSVLCSAVVLFQSKFSCNSPTSCVPHLIRLPVRKRWRVILTFSLIPKVDNAHFNFAITFLLTCWTWGVPKKGANRLKRCLKQQANEPPTLQRLEKHLGPLYTCVPVKIYSSVLCISSIHAKEHCLLEVRKKYHQQSRVYTSEWFYFATDLQL